MKQETKTIEAYTLADFCKLSQDLILDGWKFDLESNAGYPSAFGTFFSATLIKQAEVLQAMTERTVANLETASEVVTGAMQEAAEVVAEALEQATTASEAAVDTEVAPAANKRSKKA